MNKDQFAYLNERIIELEKENVELMSENELLRHRTLELSLHPCACERMAKLEAVEKAAEEDHNCVILEDGKGDCKICDSLAALREGEK